MSEFLLRMIQFVVLEGVVEIIGATYTYRVVEQKFEPRLPGFVGLVGGMLFISDSVPESFREYIFWHEVMCVEKRKRQGCAQTLQEEL
ncbi:MAG TPA: hypothetical protein VE973_03475, partial [Candidatus Limnocylindria bacterium]|nr:hypothetical protein [Candidatus Limnocylindria bacterium]